ncbi:shikimate kinase [Algoriphagus sanaruensis]|uniref:Shikimate kinase n=1 Tax=Algoriphagus sanaruensis TaxID=1727163 RepID=A0A142ELY2_9BACT|nr:shikimate kinase [Algoriphagus sanaruensis]AMQ56137.1 shikimate kinase [Algoriphagus sanaruensis]
MMKSLKVVLVGLPGSGKSTFGKQLAQVLGFTYLDLDQVIEDSHALTIPEIFSRYGEGKFREWETESLEKLLLREDSFVLATGGGAPCFNDNMDLINQHGMSVFLDVPLDIISSRLRSSKVQNRPMFEGMDQGEISLKLKSLLTQREFFYNQAKIKLSGEDFSTELLMYELINQLKS